MYKRFVILLTLLYVNVTLQALADTQMEQTTQACNEYNQSALHMIQVYQTIMEAHQSKPLLFEQLRSAQDAWLQYHSAHLKAAYPQFNYEPQSRVGNVKEQTVFIKGDYIQLKPDSVESMSFCKDLTRMIKSRTSELEIWLPKKTTQ